MINDEISVFIADSRERKRLEAAASFIQAETGKICRVQNTMFDVGQNWAWTTILIESGMKAFPYVQALNPKQQKMVVYGSMGEWMDAVKEVIAKQFK